MKSPIDLLIERRQILSDEYERVLNVESELGREKSCFTEFQQEKHLDLLAIKSMIDEYDRSIFWLLQDQQTQAIVKFV